MCIQKEAVQVEAIFKNIHSIMKTVEGVERGHRFVCKEHWDMNYYARFSALPHLVSYMDSAVMKEKVTPLLTDLEKIAKEGKVHCQNFVADDWA